MDQQSSAQHAQSPLLPPEDEKTHSSNREENQLQFFDSEAILTILTGGPQRRTWQVAINQV